jgi:hypothetical protein
VLPRSSRRSLGSIRAVLCSIGVPPTVPPLTAMSRASGSGMMVPPLIPPPLSFTAPRASKFSFSVLLLASSKRLTFHPLLPTNPLTALTPVPDTQAVRDLRFRPMPGKRSASDGRLVKHIVSAVYSLMSTVCCLPSAVCCLLLSAVCFPLALCFLLSATSYLLSAA